MVNNIIAKITPFAIVSLLYFKRLKNIPTFKKVPNVMILPNFPSNFNNCKPPKKEKGVKRYIKR